MSSKKILRCFGQLTNNNSRSRYQKTVTQIQHGTDSQRASRNSQRLSLGACAVDNDEKTFYAELKPLNENSVPEALAVTGFTLEELARDGVEPRVAMANFAVWLAKTVPSGAKQVFVGLNAPFDWSFVNYYFVHFGGANPFGHSALDIKALYMGATGCLWAQTTSAQMANRLHPKKKGTHNALDVLYTKPNFSGWCAACPANA